MESYNKFIVPGVVLLLTLVSGFWLTHTAKPLNTAIFTLHKLLALGAVVLSTIQIVNILKSLNAKPILILMLILAGLSVLALFATGAMMSIGKMEYNPLHNIHRLAVLVLVVGLAAVLINLMRRSPVSG